jgi:hypothetical protein
VGVLAGAILLLVALMIEEKAFLVLVVVSIVGPVIWLNPEVGLLMTMATIPLEILGVLTDTNQAVTLSLAKLFGSLTLVAWVGRIALERRRPVLWTPEVGFLSAFTALAALSMVWALDRADALGMVIRLGSAVVLYILTVNLVTSRPATRRVVAVLLLSTFVVVAFGFMQPYLAGSFTRGEAGYQERSYTAELDRTDADALGELVRITGTVGYTDAYAFFLATLLPLFFFRFEFDRAIWTRAGTGALILAAVSSLVLTYSRMGFLAFALSLVLLVIYGVLRLTPTRLGVVLVLVVASLPVLPGAFWYRVLSPDQYVRSTSAYARIDMLRDGYTIAARHWLLGVGIYNLRVVMGREVEYFNGLPTSPHNMYLTIFGDTGIAGLVLYLGFLWQSLRGVRLARRRFAIGGDREMSALAAAIEVSVVVFLVCNLFLESYVVKGWWSVFALGAALRLMSARSKLGPAIASGGRAVPIADGARGVR